MVDYSSRTPNTLMRNLETVVLLNYCILSTVCQNLNSCCYTAVSVGHATAGLLGTPLVLALGRDSLCYLLAVLTFIWALLYSCFSGTCYSTTAWNSSGASAGQRLSVLSAGCFNPHMGAVIQLFSGTCYSRTAWNSSGASTGQRLAVLSAGCFNPHMGAVIQLFQWDMLQQDCLELLWC